MMTFYAAAGSYQIRSEDGKNMPYIREPQTMRTFSMWRSMTIWFHSR